MARLGRQRRENPRITRARSTTTATPLVRRRVVVETQTQRRFVLVRAARRLRTKFIGRAPLSPVVPTDATVRRSNYTRARLVHLSRRPGALIVRAPLAPLVAFIRPRIVVETAAQDRLRARLGRGRRERARVVRAPSVPTATPYIAKHVVVRTQTLRRPARVRLLRRDPVLLRAALPAPPAPQRPKAPVVVRHRRPQARIQRRDPIVTRAPVVVPVATRPAPPLVIRTRRPPLIRARRRDPLVLRAPYATQAGRRPVVVKAARRPQRARLGRRDPLILRSTPFRTATPLVRRRLVLETQTGNRARVVTRRRHHSQPFIYGLAPLGYLASLARSTNPFDAPGAHGRGGSDPHATQFDPSGVNTEPSTPTISDFDPPEPR